MKLKFLIQTQIYSYLGGANYNKSERNILTNTTTTGELNVTDSYENYEFLIGVKQIMIIYFLIQV